MNLYAVIRALIDGGAAVLNDVEWRKKAHAAIDAAEKEVSLPDGAEPVAEPAPVADAVPAPAPAAAPVTAADLAPLLAELSALRAANESLTAQLAVAAQQGEQPG